MHNQRSARSISGAGCSNSQANKTSTNRTWKHRKHGTAQGYSDLHYRKRPSRGEWSPGNANRGDDYDGDRQNRSSGQGAKGKEGEKWSERSNCRQHMQQQQPHRKQHDNSNKKSNRKRKKKKRAPEKKGEWTIKRQRQGEADNPGPYNHEMDSDEERMPALIENYDSDLDEVRFEQLNQEDDESQDEGDGGDQQAHEARCPGQVQHPQQNKCEREGHLDSAKAESNRPNHGEAREGKEQQSGGTAKVILRKQSLTGPTSKVKKHQGMPCPWMKSPMPTTRQAAEEAGKEEQSHRAALQDYIQQLCNHGPEKR